jgi:simple sugar transport system substrate-binding protein
MSFTRRQVLAGAAGAAAAAAAGTPAFSSTDPLNVGFIYIGPVADAGWTTQHDIGRRKVEEVLGARVKTNFVERVAPPDFDRVANQLARAGNKLIFTTSFSYFNPTMRVAPTLPDVRFENATGTRTAPNVAIYNLRAYEARYALGTIAARKSKTGTIGYVGSFPVPEVIAAINSVMRGAWTVKPDMKIKVVWVGAWFDPGKEADAARALMDQGCDVIFQHTDSPAPLQLAGERGVFAFGNNSDMTRFAPKSHLSSIVNNWGDYYVERVRMMLDNKWAATDTWGGLGTGMVRLAPFTNMSPEIAAEGQKVFDALASNRLHPFAGPVIRQDGTVVVAEGRTLTDDEIRGMNYFVRGIDVDMPRS